MSLHLMFNQLKIKVCVCIQYVYMYVLTKHIKSIVRSKTRALLLLLFLILGLT